MDWTKNPWTEFRESLNIKDPIGRYLKTFMIAFAAGMLGMMVFLGIFSSQFYQLGMSTHEKSVIGLMVFIISAIPAGVTAGLLLNRRSIGGYLNQTDYSDEKKKLIYSIYYYRLSTLWRIWIIRIGLIVGIVLIFIDKNFSTLFEVGLKSTALGFYWLLFYLVYSEYKFIQRLYRINKNIALKSLPGLIAASLATIFGLAIVMPEVYGSFFSFELGNIIQVIIIIIIIILSEIEKPALNRLIKISDYNQAINNWRGK